MGELYGFSEIGKALYSIINMSLRHRTLIEIINLLALKQGYFINIVQYVKQHLLDCKVVSDICRAELNRRVFCSSTASFNCWKLAFVFNINYFTTY